MVDGFSILCPGGLPASYIPRLATLRCAFGVITRRAHVFNALSAPPHFANLASDDDDSDDDDDEALN